MTDTQIAIIRALQDGLPLSEEPFGQAARQVGIPLEDLLAQLRAWIDDGTIRRFGCVLRHHRAGYSANAMVVWNVPDDSVDSFGKVASSLPRVSHCYQRPRLEGFSYNLYTMIHGRAKQDCEAVAREISTRTGISDYALLYTNSEFKKSSPAYFSGTSKEEPGG